MLNQMLNTGTITEVRLTSDGYEYLVMDHDTGAEYWYAESDLSDLVEL